LRRILQVEKTPCVGYAKVDLEMKRKAIARVKPVARRSRTPWSKDSTILDWLRLRVEKALNFIKGGST
jgi:hypothetical protein